MLVKLVSIALRACTWQSSAFEILPEAGALLVPYMMRRDSMLKATPWSTEALDDARTKALVSGDEGSA